MTTQVHARSDIIERVKDCDHLDEDPPIRGQNFACVSFVTPEEVVRRREIYEFGEFMADMAGDVDRMLSALAEQKVGERSDENLRAMVSSVRERHAYMWNKDELQREFDMFRSVHSDRITTVFLRENRFETCVRGFKIRGVYETHEQAVKRCQAIQRFDKTFNVFVCEVGRWLPISPNPDTVEEGEYCVDELNTLMKQYKLNQAGRDELYEIRKREKMEEIAKEDKAKQEAASRGVPTIVDVSDHEKVTAKEGCEEASAGEKGEKGEKDESSFASLRVNEALQATDPWMKQKNK